MHSGNSSSLVLGTKKEASERWHNYNSVLVGQEIRRILAQQLSHVATIFLEKGFISVVERSTKGRARKLPIRSDICRALCFPGGSTVMISHLDKHSQDGPANSIKLPVLVKPDQSSVSLTEVQGMDLYEEGDKPSILVDPVPVIVEDTQKELNDLPEAESTLLKKYQDLAAEEKGNVNLETDPGTGKTVAANVSSTYERNTKRRVWQASSSSLKSEYKLAMIINPTQGEVLSWKLK